MQDLIDRISAALNIDKATAERAVGIVLALVRRHGDQSRVGELFAKLPGADQLAAAHDEKPGGMLGALSGAFGGAGPMAAAAKLRSAGLDMEQSKRLGREVLSYAKERAGTPLVKQVAGSIPGLGKYV